MTDQANRLLGESSPYLRQHAHNPVAWHPWGTEALALALQENKPILLSIGYASCHWCHVMAHESFEDEDTAKIMNQHFINIKVDREERPDLDQIYQIAHQIMTKRSGGWPLTVFLTPAQEPFFAGTYFPKEARFGLPAFTELLEKIAAYYQARGQEVADQAKQMANVIQSIRPQGDTTTELTDAPIRKARHLLETHYDPKFGGFGNAPKFPHPSDLHFLMGYSQRTGDKEAENMALHTLQKMAEGGLFDHLAGGFFRYSVDETWRIPHFEKMLYDNGPLLHLYTRAYRLTSDDGFRQTAEQTAQWAMSEMQCQDGGFASALDADSNGEEGAYYTWPYSELRTLLNAEELTVAEHIYGISESGNFEGKNHLLMKHPVPYAARAMGLDEEHIAALLYETNAKLSTARGKHPYPGLDEKVLTAWNALMIKGLAHAGRHLGKKTLIDSAERALAFIHANLWRDGRLQASFQKGKGKLMGYLDDYALLLDALLEMLEARWNNEHLAWAEDLAEALLDHFYDQEEGGFYFTAHDHETLIHRLKQATDQALPSGNGVAIASLLRLGFLIGETRYLDAAERSLQLFWTDMQRTPTAHATILDALQSYLTPPSFLFLRGEETAVQSWREEADKIQHTPLHCYFVPNTTQLPPQLGDKRPGSEPVLAYPCQGTTCHPPLVDFAEFSRYLSSFTQKP